MEYSYDIHSYDNISSDDELCKESTATVFLFVIQTKFTVRKRKLDHEDAYDDCEMLESLPSVPLTKSTDEGDFKRRLHRYFSRIKYRLKEYSMPDDQIQSLIHDSYEHILSADPVVPFVPIFVNVNVCTVQKDGESIEEALERSVRPDRLIPLRLVWPIKGKDCLRMFLLHGLTRYRVNEGFEHMDACPICLGGPTARDPVSLLPCRHGFHTHCVVRWLMEKDAPSCPLCRHQIVFDEEGRLKELG